MKTPFLSTSFSQNGKKAKKRFEKILELKNKRTGVVVIVGILAGLLILSSVFAFGSQDIGIIGGADGPTEIFITSSENSALDKAISEKLLGDNKGGFLEGEVTGEGHIIMGEEENKAYILTTYGEYGFVNGNMNKVSGTGVIPAVAEFTKNGNEYNITSITYPGDGSQFAEDIKRMFPAKYRERCMGGKTYDADYQTMLAQEKGYVQAYLNSIGRSDAEITDYESGALLTDLGVSVDVSNKLLDMQKYDISTKYPYHVGNQEYIEDGKRVVYEMSYKRGDPEIIYRKTDYETKNLIQEIHISADTGEIVSIIPNKEKEAK